MLLGKAPSSCVPPSIHACSATLYDVSDTLFRSRQCAGPAGWLGTKLCTWVLMASTFREPVQGNRVWSRYWNPQFAAPIARWSHCGGHGGSFGADQMAAGGELAAGILVKRPRQRSRLHALISSAAHTASERWRAWKKAEAARRPACAARPMCGARFGGTHGGHLCGTDTHDLRVPRACAPPSWHSSAAC